MKPKRLFQTVLAVMLLLPVGLRAQVERNEWSYGIVLQSNNIVYAGLGEIIRSIPATVALYSEDADKMESTGNFYIKNKWWIPTFRYRANVVQKMDVAGTKVNITPKSWGFSDCDWKLRNYAVGYHVGYLSRLFPLGFDLQADYEQNGYDFTTDGSEEVQEITKRLLSVSALLRIRLLQYDRYRINPVLELGSAYNHTLHYSDNLINDKNAVNNGFTGIVGLGFTNTETHVSWSLRYEHYFYDFYNSDFMYEGIPVFEGSKSTFGRLGVAVTYGF